MRFDFVLVLLDNNVLADKANYMFISFGSKGYTAPLFWRQILDSIISLINLITNESGMRFTFHQMRDDIKPAYVRLRISSDKVVADILYTCAETQKYEQIIFNMNLAQDRERLNALKKNLVFCDRAKFTLRLSQIQNEQSESVEGNILNDQVIIDRILKFSYAPFKNSQKN